jgi:hypothetical protein
MIAITPISSTSNVLLTPRLCHLDLLAHGHNGGRKQQDFDPRQLIAAEVE